MYDVHVGLIRKRVVEVLIELLSLRVKIVSIAALTPIAI